jgi:hypothetical protein
MSEPVRTHILIFLDFNFKLYSEMSQTENTSDLESSSLKDKRSLLSIAFEEAALNERIAAVGKQQVGSDLTQNESLDDIFREKDPFVLTLKECAPPANCLTSISELDSTMAEAFTIGIAPQTDDPTTTAFTFRSVFLGCIWGVSHSIKHI